MLIVFTAIALLSLALLPWLGQPYIGLAAWNGVPQFSVNNAWELTNTLATRFPRRWSGSADRRAAANWIADTLAGWGLEVHRDTFEAALGEDRPTVLENVWGISRGSERPNEIIVAMGNYDMAPTSYQAASDTAGHVGTILELARIIHAEPHRRTFVFLFPDGEEWGMLGARRFVRTFPDRHRIVAALSIEDLDAGRLRALGIDGIGQFRGFAPMWLRSLAEDAARREVLPAEEVGPVFEWLQRSLLISATDQGPFLEKGVAAIDLAGRGTDRVLQDRIYHLPGDTMDKMQPRSMELYGRVQERIVRAIDVMPTAPRESQLYLRRTSEEIVPGGLVLAAQGLAFLPLFGSVILGALRGNIARGLRSESLALAALIAVMIAGLAALKALPHLGLLRDYELYPPPPRHPFLTDVNWIAVLIVVAVICAAALMAQYFFRAKAASDSDVAPTTRVAVLRLWLLGVTLVTFIDNSFGAATFLLLPALLWIWIEPARTLSRRIANVVLVAAGFVPFLALVVFYSQTLRLGAYILWYLFMGAAYGQFTLLRLILTLFWIAIGVRLLLVSGRLSHVDVLREDAV